MIGANKPGCPDLAARTLFRDPSLRHVIVHGRWALWEQLVVDEKGKGRQAFRRGLLESVRHASAFGRRVTVVAGVPEYAVDVPSTVGKILWWGRKKDIRLKIAKYHERQKTVNQFLNMLKRDYHVNVLYPHSTLCHDGRCEVMRDGNVLYRDDDHLSPRGVDLLADVLRAELAAGQEATEVGQQSSAQTD